MASKSFVLKAADVELATGDGFKQELVFGVEEVEAAMGAEVFADGARELLDVVVADAGILDCRQELQIAAIGGGQQFGQWGQAVDGFPHGSPLGFAGAVAMFYLPVVLEKGNVVDGGLDAENEAGFVIELQ